MFFMQFKRKTNNKAKVKIRGKITIETEIMNEEKAEVNKWRIRGSTGRSQDSKRVRDEEAFQPSSKEIHWSSSPWSFSRMLPFQELSFIKVAEREKMSVAWGSRSCRCLWSKATLLEFCTKTWRSLCFKIHLSTNNEVAFLNWALGLKIATRNWHYEHPETTHKTVIYKYTQPLKSTHFVKKAMQLQVTSLHASFVCRAFSFKIGNLMRCALSTCEFWN